MFLFACLFLNSVHCFPSNDTIIINKLLHRFLNSPTIPLNTKKKILDTAEMLAIKSNDLDKEFEVLFQKAKLFENSNHFFLKEKVLVRLCQIAKIKKDSSLIYISCLKAGAYYYKRENYIKSLNYLLDGLNFLQIKKKSDYEKEALICLRISQAFSDKAHLSNSEFEDAKSESFIKRAINALLKTDTSQTVDVYISIYNHCGNVYRRKAYVNSNYSYCVRALGYFNLALAKAKGYRLENKTTPILLNIGSVYSDLGEYDKAMKYYTASSDNFKWLAENRSESGLIFLKIAEVYLKKFEYTQNRTFLSKSISYANSCLDSAIKYKNRSMEKSAYDALSIIYDKGNEPTKALYFYKKFFYLNDSLFNERGASEIAELMSDFSQIENQKKISDLLVRQKLAEVRIEKEKNYRWFLFIVVFILIVSITFITIGFAGRKKVNEQLAIKNKEILLRKQITPHFLFNMFNNLYVTTLKSPKVASEIVLGLSDMMRYQLKELNNQQTELLNEIEYVKNLLLLEQILKKDLSINVNYDPQEIQGVLVEPLIYTTLVENAIKHGSSNSSKGYIYARVRISKDKIIFSIINSKSSEKVSTLISGTGLKNLKERLDLGYKNKYKLLINETDMKYMAILILSKK